MNLSARQRQCLKLMGIDAWVSRAVPGPEQDPDPEAQAVPVAVEDEAWQALRREVSGCTLCALHQGRTQTVFGVGNLHAEWLLIGEAPGAEEDRRGEPFVGRAGQLLNAMLEAMGMSRDEVFIANILKCRPPNNRDPRPEEVTACEQYLQRQIRLVRPKIILALGRIAAQNLLKVDTPIGRMRGRCYEYPDPRVPVVVTYHPAYLLRSPKEKRKSWQDLRYAMRIFRELT